MSASRPAAMRKAENGIRNAVTVHCSSATETSNSRWIVGRATTTAAVGSCTMPAAPTVAASVIRWLTGRAGLALVASAMEPAGARARRPRPP